MESQRDILPAGAGGGGLGMRPESKKRGYGVRGFQRPFPTGARACQEVPRVCEIPCSQCPLTASQSLRKKCRGPQTRGQKEKGHRKSHAPSTSLYSVGTRAPRLETPQRVREATPSLKQTCFPEAILVEKRRLLCWVERCPPRPCECDLTWK